MSSKISVWQTVFYVKISRCESCISTSLSNDFYDWIYFFLCPLDYKNLCHVTIVMRMSSPKAIGKIGYHRDEKPGVKSITIVNAMTAIWPVRLAVQRLGCGAW